MDTTFYNPRLTAKLVITGFVAFALYWITGGLPILLLILGPSIFIAYLLKAAFQPVISFSGGMSQFFILLPATLGYFFLLSLHLARIMHERGLIRKVALGVTLVFLAYAHIQSWWSLNSYYSSLPY